MCSNSQSARANAYFKDVRSHFPAGMAGGWNSCKHWALNTWKVKPMPSIRTKTIPNARQLSVRSLCCRSHGIPRASNKQSGPPPIGARELTIQFSPIFIRRYTSQCDCDVERPLTCQMRTEPNDNWGCLRDVWCHLRRSVSCNQRAAHYRYFSA